MFLIISIFFVCATYTPLACGENGTLASHQPKSSNITTAASSQSNITLNAEGGSLAIIPPLSLLNDKAISIEQIGNSSIKKNKIQPRKGAPVNSSSEEEGSSVKVAAIKNQTSNAIHGVLNVKLVNKTVSMNSTAEAVNNIEKKENITNLNSSLLEMDKKKEPEHVKKPLVLSYDALFKEVKHGSHESNLPISKASSKTIVSDQIPPPNHENDTAPKTVHIGATGRSPGMVVPIVITILVVPAFAVLGYLALKKGQEAWKNRHYKRMDFLLDGMYND